MIDVETFEKLTSVCQSCVTKPCQVGCPLHNDITGFIKCIKEEKYEEAYNILSKTTVLPSICGRICPCLKQCKSTCVMKISHKPVEIGRLESMIGDMSIENSWQLPPPVKKINKKIAVIGSGPASLTCASFLNRFGCDVTIYEKHNYLGGLLHHGIPEFRLDKEILNQTINRIINQGIEVKYNQELGKDFKIEDIINNYDRIFLGIGANKSTKLEINGEDLNGVYGGNELLERNIYPDFRNKNVVVNGGGNVAIDVARTVIRKNASSVTIIYRKDEESMPANIDEIIDAKNEGVKFLFNTNIINIIGQNKVEKIECVKTKIESNENNKKNVLNIEDSNFEIKTDFVIIAIGSIIEEKIIKNLGLELDTHGEIKIDKSGKTSNNKIYAGGDVTATISTVAWASKSGRTAAESIIESFKIGDDNNEKN